MQLFIEAADMCFLVSPIATMCISLSWWKLKIKPVPESQMKFFEFERAATNGIQSRGGALFVTFIRQAKQSRVAVIEIMYGIKANMCKHIRFQGSQTFCFATSL